MSTTPATEAQRAIRVYLVDDQSMIRAGFRSLLGKDPRFQVVGDTGDPRQAPEAIAAERPDVVLLDISMPGLSGIDLIPQIRGRAEPTRIVMLTHHEGESSSSRRWRRAPTATCPRTPTLASSRWRSSRCTAASRTSRRGSPAG
jgi:DNA-binding NarL/FixJ family response regulator